MPAFMSLREHPGVSIWIETPCSLAQRPQVRGSLVPEAAKGAVCGTAVTKLTGEFG